MNEYSKFIKIYCVASPRRQAAIMLKSCAFLKGLWSYVYTYENCILILPVNIHTV